MPRRFIPAVDNKTVPVVRSGNYATGESYLKGAVLGLNAFGEFIELTSGAGVTGVAAVALEDVASKPGWNVANDNLVVFRTGVVQETSSADLVKKPDMIFSGRLTDAAGVDVTPTQDMVGTTRGLLRLANGEWTVDNDNVIDNAVLIVDIVLLEGSQAAGNYILFKFVEEVLFAGVPVVT